MAKATACYLAYARMARLFATLIIMKSNKLRTFPHKLAQCYHALEYAFTQGAFAEKCRTYFLHPFMHYVHRLSLKLFSVLMIFAGLYYLCAELMTILFSDAHLATYAKHSALELLIPADLTMGEKNGSLSPLFYTMKVAFALQAWLFILGYVVLVTFITGHQFRLLSVLCASLFSVGIAYLLSSQEGVFREGGYAHAIWFELTLLAGACAMILIALSINVERIKRFKYYSFLAGALSAICLLITLRFPTAYTPWLERVGIYSILIWEIALGFCVLRVLGHAQEKRLA